MNALFLGNQKSTDEVYSVSVQKELFENANFLSRKTLKKEELLQDPEKFKDTEVIFSTWGMFQMSEEEIETVFPNLRAVFYAAGSVQGFAKPFLKKGIKVFSAWAANAVPVAEFTVAQIVLSNKGYFQNQLLYKAKNHPDAVKFFHGHGGNYEAKIGLLGAGMIGSKVASLLRSYNCSVFVFDPFLSEEKAKNIGVKKASLEEIFRNCDVVSNHLANNEQTKNIIEKSLLSSMKPCATFINTGRGAQVNESDLIAVLKSRPDLTALLDVTVDEPISEDSELYNLQNIFLSTHIAGSSENETHRMSEYMKDEYLSFKNGEPTKYEVTLEMLSRMA